MGRKVSGLVHSIRELVLTLLVAVTDMLIAMLGICSKEELDEEELLDEEETTVASPEEAPLSEEEVAERRKAIKNKILAVGKMSRLFSVLR